MTRNGQRHPSAPPSRPARRRNQPGLEGLETRRMLSAAGTGTVIKPAATVLSPAAYGYNRGAGPVTPAQLDAAYGIAPGNNGAGQTIGIVDAFNDPNIQSDLAAFDRAYGLPAANLTVDNQYGGKSLPPSDPGWSLEIAMDVEWAHAAAPLANLVLVEANSDSTIDLATAVSIAAGRANIVAMSWGGSEFWGQSQYDTPLDFAHPNVTFLAAAGDDGGASGAEWPATSPYVVGVGGTTLTLNGAGGYGGETAWSATNSRRNGPSGGAGGTSLVYPVPAFQAAALGSAYGRRSTPDVALDGDPNTGFSVYNTVPGSGSTGWTQVAGTSAGTPVWAGIVAAADQARGLKGLGSLGSSQTLGLLYSLYGSVGKVSATYAAAFHDITSGANFAGPAGVGYDQVTGLGTPIAGTIVAAASTYRVATPSAVRIKAAVAAVSAAGLVSAADVSASVPTARVSPPAHVSPSVVSLVATAPAATATPVAPVLAPPGNPAVAANGLTRPTQSVPRVSWSSGASAGMGVPRRPPVRIVPGIFLEPEVAPTRSSGAAAAALALAVPEPAARWEAAIGAYLTGLSVPTEADQASASGPAVIEGEARPDLRPALGAAVALAVWGNAELRTRLPERGRRRRLSVRGHDSAG